MDGAVSTRKYPAYTTAQLEAAIAAGKGTPAMVQEVADRKSGASKPLVVPQIAPSVELIRAAVRQAVKSGRSFHDFWYYAMDNQQRVPLEREAGRRIRFVLGASRT